MNQEASRTARLIVGNLGCEAELAGLALKPAVERTISLFATLLRAFAREGDELWTPATVDPGRIPHVPGLPLPVLLSGRTEQKSRAHVLAWAETRRAQAFRGAGRPAPPVERPAADPPVEASRRAWLLPAAPVEAAARAHHRSFALEAAVALGCALEGAVRVHSLEDLDRHLASGGARAAPREAWVVKAPYSASGRDRVRGQGRRLEGALRRSVERLLESHGELLFEPWMDRTADFGVCALLDDDSIVVFPPHVLEVDVRGAFRGIVLDLDPDAPPVLQAAERESLDAAVSGVAGRLRKAGYRGPFSVDCWRHRGPDGRERFQSLGEVNARMSFGLVARALAERLSEEGRVPRSGAIRLRLGDGTDLEASLGAAHDVTVLVTPASPESEAVWIESAALATR